MTTIKTWQERYNEACLLPEEMNKNARDMISGAKQAEIDELRAELDKLKKQEPVGYVRKYTVEFLNKPGRQTVINNSPQDAFDVPLYLAAGAQPDTKEMAELRADVEPCQECGSRNCNGECSGDGTMGD